MGVSDKFHFEWHREIAAKILPDIANDLNASSSILCLGEMQTPAMLSDLKWLAMPNDSMTFFDVQNHGQSPQHVQGDINDLSLLESKKFDIVTCFRSSYFVNEKNVFLDSLGRILKPGGFALIDWLHGHSDRPVIDFSAGGPVYNGMEFPFNATYIDEEFPLQFSAEFQAFLDHVNRPPLTGLDKYNPFVLMSQKQKNDFNLENYPSRLRHALEGKSAHLITEADFLSRGMSVKMRSARYFFPLVGKFNLYIFTLFQKCR